MIGLDLLGHVPFTIDYQAKEIAFGPINPAFASMPYRPGLPYAIVDLDVQGRRLGILVDTGASDLVLFASALQHCLWSTKKAHSATWSNLGGDIHVNEAQLTDAHFGSLRWDERAVYVLQDTETISGIGGLLGTKALGARRVAFDPDRREPEQRMRRNGRTWQRAITRPSRRCCALISESRETQTRT